MRPFASFLTTLLVCSSVLALSACSSSYKPKGKAIPEGFLINCYPQSECTKADSTPLPNHQAQQIVVLITSDDLEKVVAWYKTELTFKGFRVLSDNNFKGTLTLESENDKTHCTVTCVPLKDYTVISISTFPKPI